MRTGTISRDLLKSHRYRIWAAFRSSLKRRFTRLNLESPRDDIGVTGSVERFVTLRLLIDYEERIGDARGIESFFDEIDLAVLERAGDPDFRHQSQENR